MRGSFLLLLAAEILLACPAWAEKAQLEGVVNLNTASAEELALIPGVGPARVRNILAFRHLHPFRSVDELARIKGIGRKTIRRWRQHLAVSGPSTAQRVVRPESPVAAPFVGTFVGPPPSAATPSPPAKAAVAAASAHPTRAGPRRGEPAHAFFPRASGDGCLPPP